MELLARFKGFGYEKLRRAAALLPLSFFASVYLLIGLAAPPGWRPAMLALGGCYLLAFVALAAEWFWGRWFASGLGWSGLVVGGYSLLLAGWSPPLAIYTGLHGLVVVCLLGEKMAACYDLQEGWRQRFGMDEYGVARLRKTVTRAAASLPAIIVWALAPREQASLGALCVIGAAGLGLAAVLRLRTWGLMALGGSATALALAGAKVVAGAPSLWTVSEPVAGFGVGTAVAALLLSFSVLPFARPALGFFLASGRRA